MSREAFVHPVLNPKESELITVLDVKALKSKALQLHQDEYTLVRDMYHFASQALEPILAFYSLYARWQKPVPDKLSAIDQFFTQRKAIVDSWYKVLVVLVPYLTQKLSLLDTHKNIQLLKQIAQVKKELDTASDSNKKKTLKRKKTIQTQEIESLEKQFVALVANPPPGDKKELQQDKPTTALLELIAAGEQLNENWMTLGNQLLQAAQQAEENTEALSLSATVAANLMSSPGEEFLQPLSNTDNVPRLTYLGNCIKKMFELTAQLAQKSPGDAKKRIFPETAKIQMQGVNISMGEWVAPTNKPLYQMLENQKTAKQQSQTVIKEKHQAWIEQQAQPDMLDSKITKKDAIYLATAGLRTIFAKEIARLEFELELAKHRQDLDKEKKLLTGVSSSLEREHGDLLECDQILKGIQQQEAKAPGIAREKLTKAKSRLTSLKRTKASKVDLDAAILEVSNRENLLKLYEEWYEKLVQAVYNTGKQVIKIRQKQPSINLAKTFIPVIKEIGDMAVAKPPAIIAFHKAEQQLEEAEEIFASRKNIAENLAKNEEATVEQLKLAAEHVAFALQTKQLAEESYHHHCLWLSKAKKQPNCPERILALEHSAKLITALKVLKDLAGEEQTITIARTQLEEKQDNLRKTKVRSAQLQDEIFTRVQKKYTAMGKDAPLLASVREAKAQLTTIDVEAGIETALSQKFDNWDEAQRLEGNYVAEINTIQKKIENAQQRIQEINDSVLQGLQPVGHPLDKKQLKDNLSAVLPAEPPDISEVKRRASISVQTLDNDESRSREEAIDLLTQLVNAIKKVNAEFIRESQTAWFPRFRGEVPDSKIMLSRENYRKLAALQQGAEIQLNDLEQASQPADGKFSTQDYQQALSAIAELLEVGYQLVADRHPQTQEIFLTYGIQLANAVDIPLANILHDLKDGGAQDKKTVSPAPELLAKYQKFEDKNQAIRERAFADEQKRWRRVLDERQLERKETEQSLTQFISHLGQGSVGDRDEKVSSRRKSFSRIVSRLAAPVSASSSFASYQERPSISSKIPSGEVVDKPQGIWDRARNRLGWQNTENELTVPISDSKSSISSSRDEQDQSNGYLDEDEVKIKAGANEKASQSVVADEVDIVSDSSSDDIGNDYQLMDIPIDIPLNNEKKPTDVPLRSFAAAAPEPDASTYLLGDVKHRPMSSDEISEEPMRASKRRNWRSLLSLTQSQFNQWVLAPLRIGLNTGFIVIVAGTSAVMSVVGSTIGVASAGAIWAGSTSGVFAYTLAAFGKNTKKLVRGDWEHIMLWLPEAQYILRKIIDNRPASKSELAFMKEFLKTLYKVTDRTQSNCSLHNWVMERNDEGLERDRCLMNQFLTRDIQSLNNDIPGAKKLLEIVNGLATTPNLRHATDTWVDKYPSIRKWAVVGLLPLSMLAIEWLAIFSGNVGGFSDKFVNFLTAAKGSGTTVEVAAVQFLRSSIFYGIITAGIVADVMLLWTGIERRKNHFTGYLDFAMKRGNHSDLENIRLARGLNRDRPYQKLAIISENEPESFVLLRLNASDLYPYWPGRRKAIQNYWESMVLNPFSKAFRELRPETRVMYGFNGAMGIVTLGFGTMGPLAGNPQLWTACTAFWIAQLAPEVLGGLKTYRKFMGGETLPAGYYANQYATVTREYNHNFLTNQYSKLLQAEAKQPRYSISHDLSMPSPVAQTLSMSPSQGLSVDSKAPIYRFGPVSAEQKFFTPPAPLEIDGSPASHLLLSVADEDVDYGDEMDECKKNMEAMNNQILGRPSDSSSYPFWDKKGGKNEEHPHPPVKLNSESDDDESTLGHR